MKLKPVVALLGLVASAGAFAAGDMNARMDAMQSQLNQLNSQVNGMGSMAASGRSAMDSVATNVRLSEQVLGFQKPLGSREVYVLKARQDGMNNGLVIGGGIRADVIYASKNVQALSMQLETPEDTSGAASGVFSFPVKSTTSPNNSVSKIKLSAAELHFLANPNDLATVVVDLAYLHPASSAQGILADGSLKVHQSYLLLGNLNKMPVYMFAGKKAVDFGSFAGVNSGIPELTRGFAIPPQGTVGFGYLQGGIFGAFSLINGNSTGLVGTYPSHTYSDNGRQINNWALTLHYDGKVSDLDYGVGAAYLSGAMPKRFRTVDFSAATPIARLSEASNGAEPFYRQKTGMYDFNVQATMHDVHLNAEYVMTASDIKADTLTLKDGTAYTDFSSKLRSWDVGVAYDMEFMGRHADVHASYSSIKLQKKSSLVVVGVEHEVADHVKASLEYGSLNAKTGLGSGESFTVGMVDFALKAYF